jgi:hypothetical protein
VNAASKHVFLPQSQPQLLVFLLLSEYTLFVSFKKNLASQSKRLPAASAIHMLIVSTTTKHLLSEEATRAAMDLSASDDIFEYLTPEFPGTARQAKRFRKWITDTNAWLHPFYVHRWMRANTGVILEAGEEIPIIREALCYIALELQEVIVSLLSSYLSNLSFIETLARRHHPPTWLRASLRMDTPSKDRFPIIITNEGIAWTAKAILIRELCMLKLVEEITNKPNWWKKVRDARLTEKWKKETLELDWSKYMKYADFTSSMAEWVRHHTLENSSLITASECPQEKQCFLNFLTSAH